MKKIRFFIILMAMSLGYAQPDASPTDPPIRNAWDVMSLYSDAYSNLSGVQFLNFGAGNINADYTPTGGNPCKYITNHSYSGIQVNTAGVLDVSSMTHLHFDVWSPNYSSMNIKLESSTGAYRELAVTGSVVPSVSTRSQWISIDLALSTYNTGNVLSSLKYIVPVTYGQNATLYVDNIYFYRPTTNQQPPTFGAFTIPAKLVGDADFNITAPTSNSNGAITYSSSNTSVATIVNGSQIHIVGAGSSVITASQAATTDYAAGSTTATLNVSYPALTVDAPAAPARNAWDVISLYSSAYTDLSGTDWYPNWGQSTTYSNYTPNTNETKRYENLNYQGVQLAANANVSNMTTLHLDIYSPDATALDFRLIAGGEFNKTITLTPGQWNSIDIPLTQYAGANLMALNQLKFQTNPFGSLRNTIYLDNVYFYRPATALPSPTLSNFSIPASSVGAPDFNITDPTSNSSGAFTYSSSNSSVATVSGNTITVVGVGSTTITATQAGTTDYGTGTITATFDVAPGAAPTPTVNASQVISLYSDAYTNVAGTDWNPNWGQSTQVTGLNVGGNAMLKYSNMNYQGVQFASPINASGMVSLHLDVYTQNCTAFDVYLINLPSTEKKVTLTPTANGWNSFDILLSQYTGIDLSNIGQFKFVATPFGSSTVYVDNIYFSSVPITVAPILSNFTIPTKVMGASPFAITAPTSSSNGAFTYTSSNTSVAVVAGSTVIVIGVGTTTITATQAASGSYTSGTISADFVVTAPLPTAPTTAAPTPPVRSSSNVISLFSDAYTNVDGIDWNPNWGQSTGVQDTTIAGDNTKVYTNLNYQGVQLGATINATSMTHLHIDIWTSNCTAFDVYPIVSGQPEQKVTLTPTLAGWNSFDIDLTQYTIPLANIMQFKFVGTPFGSSKVYMDNMYFWRPNTAPDIAGFTVPAKFVGDAPFTLTEPLSNSTGAFTYTSSNTAVATISGNVVTIVGAGSATITANQAAAAPFTAGSTSAVLTVSYPGPSTAAPSPTVNASNVISLFSGVYTNVANVNWYPNWGQVTTLTNTTAGGDDVKKYSNMNYQGVQFASAINASSMVRLHIDLWTPNCTSFDVYLINQGIREQKVTVTPTLMGWNSFDIPLSQFNTVDLSNIGQFKFVATPSGSSDIYLDNIYFSNVPFAPVASAQSLCNGATVAQLTAAGSNLQWYSAATGGTALASSTVLATGTYYVSQTVNNVESARTAVAVTINTTPALPSGLTFYVTSNTPIQSIFGFSSDSYKVYSSATSPTPLAGTTILTNGTYYTSQVQNGCESARTATTVVTYTAPTIRSTTCGTTLATVGSGIFCTAVSGASQYKFEVTAGGQSQVCYSNTNSFNLTQLSTAVAYNTTYSIRVAAGFSGQFGNYGAACNVTTPSIGTTSLNSSSCNTSQSSRWSRIFCNQVYGATAYIFTFTRNGNSLSYTSTTNSMQLFNIAGLVAGVTYSVTVKAQVGTQVGAAGNACNLTLLSNYARNEAGNAQALNTKAVPNPFANDFSLVATGGTDSPVWVNVYDMTGRLVESFSSEAHALQDLSLGHNYASGVYNISITQGDESQVVRVVKR